MITAEEIIFILLLANLQSTKNAGVTGLSLTATTSSLNNTTISSTIFINKSSNKYVTSGITPSVILTSPTDSDVNTGKNTVTESNTQSSSNVTPLNTWLSSMAHQLNLTTKDSNQTSARINGTPSPSVMPTVSSGLSTISENYSVTTYINLTEKALNNSNTANYNVSHTTTVSLNGTQINGITVHPTSSMPNTPTMSSGTKINSVTVELKNTDGFTDGSAEAREPQKENHNNGAVVFGAIVGAVLGSALISLVGYFMCGKRKTDSFAHQRLYDDMRNDPVLRLDNVHEPYGASFGNLSYSSPTTVNESAAHSNRGSPYDAIQMNDMSSSEPSAK